MKLEEFLKHWRLLYPRLDSLEGNGEVFAGKFGDELHARCPLCDTVRKDLGPDKSHHCRVLFKEGWFKCFRCGSKGGLHKLLGKDEMWQKEKEKAKDWASYT